MLAPSSDCSLNVTAALHWLKCGSLYLEPYSVNYSLNNVPSNFFFVMSGKIVEVCALNKNLNLY